MDMEDVETPEEAIVAEVDELADAPDGGPLAVKVKFTDILIS